MELALCIAITLVALGMVVSAYIAGYCHGCSATAKMMKKLFNHSEKKP